MSTNTTKTELAKTNTQVLEYKNNLTKIIQDNTPVFVSKNIISASNSLEFFRLNSFNSVFIFYPVLGILIFLILRFFYRKLF